MQLKLAFSQCTTTYSPELAAESTRFPGRSMFVNAGKRNDFLCLPFVQRVENVVFFCSEPFFAWLTKCLQEFSSRKHAFFNIFRCFTIYYGSVNPWKITVILPFTAVLYIPTSYSLELTS